MCLAGMLCVANFDAAEFERVVVDVFFGLIKSAGFGYYMAGR